MLGFRVPEIILGAALATALWAVVWNFTSQEAKPNNHSQPTISETVEGDPPVSRSTNHEQAEEGSKERQWSQIFTDHPTEWLLVLFAAILAYSTQRLVWGAEDTVRRQLRAYVHIFRCHIVRENGDRKITGVRIVFKNSGQTPAYNISVGDEAEIRCPADDKPSKTWRIEPTSANLGPDSEYHITVDVQKTAAETGIDLAAIDGKASCLLIFGEFQYSDAFDRCWHTCFRFCFNGNKDFSLYDNLFPCEHGNEAT